MEKVFTNTAHVRWIREQIAAKRPYWYGVYYLPCTEALLAKKTKQYPAHYKANRFARYSQDIKNNQIAGDCVNGAIKGAVWRCKVNSCVYAPDAWPGAWEAQVETGVFEE